MKKVKFLVGIALLVFTVLVTYGLFTMPKIQDETSDSFSAERVAKDLKYISKEPHSVEQPSARGRVRQYLYDRLEQMGGEPVVYSYDSIEFRLGGYYDIGNVFCTFEPETGKASSYVLLVAHMDSRFRQEVLKDTVYSYGAADDGYGLGVIMESVSQALKYRTEWNQGIKILFTDSEENRLDGMKKSYAENRELFENVGLVINVEARGVKGPVLLFETSGGNTNLMNLYKETKYPSTYSLTTVVYGILPNFSDFSVVKDSLVGMNFSVIDNMSYYHTDRDNYSNINLKSIQHYGAQIDPILKKYLTDKTFSDTEALRSGEDEVFFTVPGFNLFHFSKGQYHLFNSIVFALFCIAFAFNVLTGGVKTVNVLRNAMWIFIVSLGVIILGEGVAYLSALITGAEFDITATKFVKGENIINIAMISIMAAAYVIFFLKKKKKSHLFVKETLFGAMLVMVIFSAVLLFTIGENFFFIVPVALCSVVMICYLFVFLNLLSLPALLAIAMLEFSFLYNLLTALTIGSLGIVMFIAFYSIILMVGMFDCYMYQKR